jgi:hypothetical protein
MRLRIVRICVAAGLLLCATAAVRREVLDHLVRGAAADDADFVGAGDRVQYRIALRRAGRRL